MAKEFYDWIKLALDNKWLVMLLFTGLSSAATNVVQLKTNMNKEAEKQQAIREVATGFQQVMVEIEPKEKIVHKSDCGICVKLIKDHERRLH